jgi:glutathione S-transferase
VRDIRVRWALEEAGLAYRVESVPFGARNAEHFAHQPFGQVPWLTDGDISIFEGLVDRFDGLAKYPACRDYVARATARPSFVKAYADQMAHFAAAEPPRVSSTRS